MLKIKITILRGERLKLLFHQFMDLLLNLLRRQKNMIKFFIMKQFTEQEGSQRYRHEEQYESVQNCFI